jgi:hypothetical protein
MFRKREVGICFMSSSDFTLIIKACLNNIKLLKANIRPRIAAMPDIWLFLLLSIYFSLCMIDDLIIGVFEALVYLASALRCQKIGIDVIVKLEPSFDAEQLSFRLGQLRLRIQSIQTAVYIPHCQSICSGGCVHFPQVGLRS